MAINQVFVLSDFCTQLRECEKEHTAALIASYNDKTDQQELIFCELDPHPEKSTTNRTRPKGVDPLNDKLTICDVTLEKVKWDDSATQVTINQGTYKIAASVPLLQKVKDQMLSGDSSADNCAKLIKKTKT
mmetsp:Transcript_14682/g.19013  ORF Transcript_14682/g.19013 Transcript_14682/m.19013 type:complete len:131 (+) Transcript_14682:249-641(+)